MINPIRHYKESTGISIFKMSRDFGIPVPTLRHLIYDDTNLLNLRLKTVLKLQDGMKVELIEWIKNQKKPNAPQSQP